MRIIRFQLGFAEDELGLVPNTAWQELGPCEVRLEFRNRFALSLRPLVPSAARHVTLETTECNHKLSSVRNFAIHTSHLFFFWSPSTDDLARVFARDIGSELPSLKPSKRLRTVLGHYFGILWLSMQFISQLISP